MHDDHDHDHDPEVAYPSDEQSSFREIEGMEQYTLTSSGIDIGSSTSHVIVSRLTIRRRGSQLSTEFEVTGREIIYVSPPLLTPYATTTKMDVGQIEQFVRAAYEEAGLRPDEIDTGVVVITGEALNKENAAEIADVVARWSGDFMCVSAGALHEAILAAHGSGSVSLSKRTDETVLNVDIGGGTTKVSLIQRGEIVYREAFSAGARLIAWQPDGRVARLEAPAHLYAAHTGLDVRLGAQISADDSDRMAELMARVVLDAVVPGSVGPLRRRLMVTDATATPPGARSFDRIVFSGGVSEYIEGRETTSFGDLGYQLGTHIRRQLDELGLLEIVTTADHGIRATVIGASQFSIQASGQTCYILDEGSLPVRNLPVVPVELRPEDDPDRTIAVALCGRDREGFGEPIVLAVRFAGARSYAALRRYADALARAADGHPIYLVLRDDLAQSFGHLIAVEANHRGPVTVVDGITVGDLDYLDIGRPVESARSVPVTIKSLAFPQSRPTD